MRSHAKPAAVLFAALLCACGGGGGSSPVVGGPVGDPGTETEAAMQSYLEVIRGSSRFDECFGTSLLAKCERGARAGSALAGAVYGWAEDQFRAIPGLTAVQRQGFGFPVFQLRGYGLEVEAADGSRTPVPAFPWYFQGTTPAEGVSGDIVYVNKGGALDLLGKNLQGKIALLRISLVLNGESGNAQDVLKTLAERGAAGAIVATDAPGNEIAAQNRDVPTYGLGTLPTVIVGKQAAAAIREQGARARIVVDASYRESGTESNVAALLPGRDPDNIIVVGTPVNGWFLSAGERGPGVGMLVYLARHFAEKARKEGPLPYSIYFVASGGHQVYAYGLNRFMACIPKEKTVAYVHLGSGLVYKGYRDVNGEPEATGGLSQVRTLSVSENPMLTAITRPAFDSAAIKPFYQFPPSVLAPGENQGPYAKGIPSVGMNGTNQYFHTLKDDESQIVTAALGPMAAAFRDTVQGLLDTNADSLRAANAVAAGLGSRYDAPFWSCAAPLAGLQ
ncbi:PA domain-containing protein [Solimonas fluminis]|uniref:PA domain-containing protein n=1 Tax=Solimonas fluminis TaxID=2086571 RepID=UPI0013FDC82B|nr:PA domain-containing protein [Solimonas fluminis]